MPGAFYIFSEKHIVNICSFSIAIYFYVFLWFIAQRFWIFVIDLFTYWFVWILMCKLVSFRHCRTQMNFVQIVNNGSMSAAICKIEV